MKTEFSRQEIGRFGEKHCEKYLKRTKKLKIYAKNARIGHLEADIIAYNKESIIFVEVKTRSKDKKNFLTPADSVDLDKRNNLINFAYSFVRTLPTKLQNLSIRIDVCEIWVVTDKKLRVCDFNYIENAVTK